MTAVGCRPDAVVESDLGRTFPNHCLFGAGGAGRELLQAVLRAYGWDDLAESARCEFLLDYEEEEDDADAGPPAAGARKKSKKKMKNFEGYTKNIPRSKKKLKLLIK